MLNKIIAIATLIGALSFPFVAYAAPYGKVLCKNADYTCINVPRGGSWDSMFSDESERNIVKIVNRMNTPLKGGMVIAVPKDLDNVNILALSPLPQQGSPSSVYIDLSDLAWGAYNEQGNLIKWGAMSGGKNYCANLKRGCKTIIGNYTFYRKQGPSCISSRFPLPRGGAPMPYCMHFHGGYALHASATVPGHHASHGCVRVFYEDAKWLNQNFVKTGTTRIRVVP